MVTIMSCQNRNLCKWCKLSVCILLFLATPIFAQTSTQDIDIPPSSLQLLDESIFESDGEFVFEAEFVFDSNHSVARLWNEALLEAIRNDFARPVVHARNLFHSSAASYDAWAIFNPKAETYLLGKEVHGYQCSFKGFKPSTRLEDVLSETISHANYNLLRHRFKGSPGQDESYRRFDALMDHLGLDKDNRSIDYASTHQAHSGAALGNHIARCYIYYGLRDGANERNRFVNQNYQPLNEALNPESAGNPLLLKPNHWQPLQLSLFVDQSGFEIFGDVIPFLGPEWGTVLPFALSKEDATVYERDDFSYTLYHDSGGPALLSPDNTVEENSNYRDGFSMVSVWGSHLDPRDQVMIDISPASMGNFAASDFPKDATELMDFYSFMDGGDASSGHVVNPFTNEPYKPQLVPRGDFTRVLAEFWADGPDSETPPGHWFTILNTVSDHPELVKKYRGQGNVLNDLEWDVKAYFSLAGAMHDSAIAAWGIKGWYDYVRPISAIRYMADKGQSSDPNLPNYNVMGLGLIPNYIEQVTLDDPLVGEDNQNLDKIKLYTWRGPDYIGNPQTDIAGVGWILAENWWPYQRPTFVTPPFAGYVSGHSTFSRAAAETLTLLTGDPFFPGGMGEFIADKKNFLVFEKGPGVEVKLQWATYRDASDQTSLSRIWGGIHPPIDDIAGRLIGIEVGIDAFCHADLLFEGIVDDFDEQKERCASAVKEDSIRRLGQ